MTQLVRGRLSSSVVAYFSAFFSFFATLAKKTPWPPTDRSANIHLLSSNTCCFWTAIVIHLVATNRLPLNQTSLCARLANTWSTHAYLVLRIVTRISYARSYLAEWKRPLCLPMVSRPSHIRRLSVFFRLHVRSFLSYLIF